MSDADASGQCPGCRGSRGKATAAAAAAAWPQCPGVWAPSRQQRRGQQRPAPPPSGLPVISPPGAGGVPPWDVAPSWAAAALPPAPAAPWAAAPLSSFTVTVARVSAWALAEAESPCDEEDVTQASQAASHYSKCSKGSHAKSIAQPCCPLPSVWADRTCAEAPAASTARRRAASAAAVAKPFMALLCDAIWRKDEVLVADQDKERSECWAPSKAGHCSAGPAQLTVCSKSMGVPQKRVKVAEHKFEALRCYSLPIRYGSTGLNESADLFVLRLSRFLACIACGPGAAVAHHRQRGGLMRAVATY